MKLYSKLLGACSTLALACFSVTAVHAATIDVTETSDAYDGAVCTLRNAIQSVNDGADFGGCSSSSPDAYGTNDTINLIADTYVLSLGGGGENDNQFGDLDILTSVTINGAGSAQTTVSGSGFPTDEEDRIFHITDSANEQGGFTPSITVNFNGLTIRDGDSTDSGEGGGLAVEYFEAAVNLSDVIVTENLNQQGDAGGIINTEAFLTLTNSQLTNNQALGDAGGALENEGGTIVFINSTVDGNFALRRGGGVNNDGAMLFVNSTVSRNSAFNDEVLTDGISGAGTLGGSGGGIESNGFLFMINSTVSNNEAGFLGGGINVFGNDGVGDGPISNLVLLFNVTVAQNNVLSDVGFGGGLCHDCQIFPGGALTSEFEVYNTIVAGNQAANSPDCGGDFVSGNFNLIGDPQACNGFTEANDQVNVADAGLGPLQNNGGDTETHALLEGSPAIDMANNVEGCQAPNVEGLLNIPDIGELGTVTLEVLTEDQRELTRPVAVLDPAVPVCDIGAYEFQVAEPTPTPTPTATPVPPFNALLEGSGCSLASGSSAAASGLLWSAMAFMAGFYGWRRLQDRA